MTARDWRRLAQIREQQERMARLKLATAAGRVREAMAIHEAHLAEAAASNQVWEQLLRAPLPASHWAAMAGANAVQQRTLLDLEQQVHRTRAAMEQVGAQHRETVVDKEMAATLVERQLAEERREAWMKLQNLIDEHTSSSRNREPGFEALTE